MIYLKRCTTKTCAQCGNQFGARDHPCRPRIYCSKKCAALARVAVIGMPEHYRKPTLDDLKNFQRVAR